MNPNFPNPGNFNPADFGAEGISFHPNGYGGLHYTAWGNQSGQISWDVDRFGNYLGGDNIHLSDRNIPGPGGLSVWK